MEKLYQLHQLDNEIEEINKALENLVIENEIIKLRIRKKKLILKKYELLNIK